MWPSVSAKMVEVVQLFPSMGPFFTKVSSTYLNQQRGLWVAIFIVSSSKSCMMKLVIIGYTGKRMATLSVFCRTAR